MDETCICVRKQFSNGCIDTAAVLLFFNDLFDSVKGRVGSFCVLGLCNTNAGHYDIFWKSENGKTEQKKCVQTLCYNIERHQLSVHSSNANCEADQDKYLLQNLETIFEQDGQN